MSQKYRKCFITVGTTRFDRLCKVIDTPDLLDVFRNIGCKEITFQIGNSTTVEPQTSFDNGIQRNYYRFKDSIQQDIKDADFVISHAGAGSCLEVLEANKPLLVVVNEDLMDNHQLELADQLQNDGHLYHCTCDTLECTLKEIDFSFLKPFPKPNPSGFVKFLDDVLKVKQRLD